MTSNKIITLLLTLHIIFCSTLGYAQQQMTSLGVGVAPTTDSKIAILAGWGDYIQFRRTQDKGYWAIHNPQKGDALTFYHRNAAGAYAFGIMTLFNTGKVALGNVKTTPNDFLLFVEKGIMTEQVKVALATTWPDYVFAPTYSLMPLSAVKTFIQTNHHLPNMPSAATLTKEEGFELGKMTTLQQEKIEELFLHVIQLEEKLKKVEADNQALQKVVDALNK